MDAPTRLTPHQCQYVASQLSRRATAGSEESLGATLFDALVDLNPHQVEAALFVCSNPLSRGVTTLHKASPKMGA